LRSTIACLLAPTLALAEQPADESSWDLRAAIYGYFPDIDGTTRFASPIGGEIQIDAHDLVRNTELALMGAFEAQKGKWGVFTDLIYLDLSDSISGSTTLGKGAVPLPPGVTADATLDVEAWISTTAANRRLLSSETNMLDVFVGARFLDVEGTLDLALASPLGPVGAAASSVERDSWNGIVGIKGKYSFGSRDQWFVPYYFDAGAGDADRTSQGSVGIGYTTRVGEVFATYRYFNYEFDTDSKIEDLDFAGPAIGFSHSF
jgi:hypothetical protein